MTARTFKDLTGQKFGRLTVISRCENNKYGQAQWLCECTCGKRRKVMSWCLTKYKVTHCGNCPNPYTNYDKIRKMTVDEMAKYLHEITTCDFCPAEDLCDKAVENDEDYACTKIIKQYLLQEVEE